MNNYLHFVVTKISSNTFKSFTLKPGGRSIFRDGIRSCSKAKTFVLPSVRNSLIMRCGDSWYLDSLPWLIFTISFTWKNCGPRKTSLLIFEILIGTLDFSISISFKSLSNNRLVIQKELFLKNGKKLIRFYRVKTFDKYFISDFISVPPCNWLTNFSSQKREREMHFSSSKLFCNVLARIFWSFPAISFLPVLRCSYTPNFNHSRIIQKEIFEELRYREKLIQ